MTGQLREVLGKVQIEARKLTPSEQRILEYLYEEVVENAEALQSCEEDTYEINTGMDLEAKRIMRHVVRAIKEEYGEAQEQEEKA